MRFLALAILLVGCTPGPACHNPSAWRACGDFAQAGSTGTPPSLDAVLLPTCAYVSDPVLRGEIDASDEDGDIARIRVSFYVGPRLDEADYPVSRTGSLANDAAITLGGAKIGSVDVRLKVTDSEGGQSASACQSVALVN